MSGLDAFEIGRRNDLGTYTFTPEAIIAFARKFDPQPFHLDEEAARQSLLGALCASGWHTTAVWMKKNMEFRDRWLEELESSGRPIPVMGPSPGFRNLKWLRPVFAGDTIHYFNTYLSARQRKTKPEWGIVELHSEGFNENGEQVIAFDSAVLVRI
ncbi:MaoC family dehydratase [Hoeflea sp.]|uniref:MaoC family dehydratase n=1 Tax=Hoeflea sp. TaxID=1940281 RepID=UPI003B0270FF